MKRIVILFLAVLLALSGILGTSLAVGVTQDQVTHDEAVLCGDPAAAEGLEVSLRYGLDHNYLLWYTDCSFDREMTSQTDFNCHVFAPNFSQATPDYAGVHMEVVGSYMGMDYLENIFRMEIRNGATGVLPGMLGAYQELYNETPEGGLTNTYIRFADHCEYYPLAGVIELPTGGYHWNIYSQSSYFWGGKETAEAFNAYFRIPVLPDDQLQVVVDKRTGTVMESVDVTNWRKGEDWYDISNVGVCHENTAYFTFNAITEKGNTVDTSLIPGGYGLYSFTFGENGKVDTASLKTLRPLDPSFVPYEMKIDEEFGNLHYFTTKDNSIYLTVIDLNTMETLQEICVQSADADSWQHYWLQDNCIISVAEDNRITVWQKNDAGLYEYRFTTLLYGENDGFDLYYAEFAFDGERLAVGNWIEGHYIVEENIFSANPISGYSLEIYTEEGCVYSGRYTASLESKDTHWRDQRCRLHDISLTWN